MLIGASEILSKTWLIYKTNFRQLVPYLLLLVFPFVILAIISGAGLYLEKYITSSAVLNEVTFLGVVILTVFLLAWMYTALIKAVGSLVSIGTAPHWKVALAQSLPLLWPLFYTLLIVGVITFFGYVLFIIPGLIFSIWYAFAHYNVIFQNERGMDALRASKHMVQGRWWAILFRLLLPSFIIKLGTLAVIVAVTIPTVAIPNPEIADIVRNLLSAILNLIFVPLSLIASIVLYYSARENPVAGAPSSSPAHL